MTAKHLIVLLILVDTEVPRIVIVGVASRLNEPLRSRDRQRIPPLRDVARGDQLEAVHPASVLLMIIAGVLSEIPPFT